jgi:hypothetical protein
VIQVLSLIVRNSTYFLLGFLLLDIARRATVLPVPRPIEQRMEPVLAERRSCSVLFVGPSYVESQIIPEDFNREADRIGLNERACKFGASGLRGYELRWSIERLLAHDWPRLRLVVVDITLGDSIGFDADNWLKPRMIEWHTVESFPWLLAYYDEREPLPFGDRISRLTAHAKHVAAHHLEIGRGLDALGSLKFLERFRPNVEPSTARRSSNKWRLQGRRHERRIAKLIRNRRRHGPTYGDSGWAMELREVVRSRGKEAWFLIAPVLGERSIPRRSVRGRDRLVVLDLNDPARFPELYTEDVRGRTHHLRGHGKRLYSERLAREIKARRRKLP